MASSPDNRNDHARTEKRGPNLRETEDPWSDAPGDSSRSASTRDRTEGTEHVRRDRTEAPEQTDTEEDRNRSNPPAEDRQPPADDGKQDAEKQDTEEEKEQKQPAEEEGKKDQEPAKRKSPGWVKPVGMVALVIALLIGAVWGVRAWSFSRTHVSTDDAQLTTDLVQITPQINGNVTQVLVADNQQVKQGQTLVLLDDRDFIAQVAQAQAALADARAAAQGAAQNVGLTAQTTQAQIDQARAAVKQAQDAVRVAQEGVVSAQANADKTARDAVRYAILYREDAISSQQADTARAAAITAAAQRDQARRQVASAQADLAKAQAALDQALAAPHQVAISRSNRHEAQAKVQQAQATLDTAQLALSRTRIVAPVNGMVSKKSVEVGQQVSIGQALMAIVPNNDIWVVANFKETQMQHVRNGQPAEIEVDELGGKRFQGHVDSIAAATGATFSLLPPDNATGNYTRIVQRVPVKIVLNPGQKDMGLLRGGLSVTAIITTSGSR